MVIGISSRTIESDFAKKVQEISGQNFKLCYQCGLCSARCPMSFAMDLLPRQIIRLMQLGMEERIANSRTVWLCASCFTCTISCPRGVDLSKLMEAVRLVSLRKNINHVEPKKIPAEELAELPQLALVGSFRKFTA